MSLYEKIFRYVRRCGPCSTLTVQKTYDDGTTMGPWLVNHTLERLASKERIQYCDDLWSVSPFSLRERRAPTHSQDDSAHPMLIKVRRFLGRKPASYVALEALRLAIIMDQAEFMEIYHQAGAARVAKIRGTRCHAVFTDRFRDYLEDTATYQLSRFKHDRRCIRVIRPDFEMRTRVTEDGRTQFYRVVTMPTGARTRRGNVLVWIGPRSGEGESLPEDHYAY